MEKREAAKLMGDKKRLRSPRFQQTPADTNSEPGDSGAFPKWFLIGMSIAGITCLTVGGIRHGFELWPFLSTSGYLLSGIICAAIGLLELE